MKAIYTDVIGMNDSNNPSAGLIVRAVLLAESTPSSLTITGADVDGMGETDTIAAGSVLITPGANYIAFEDGTFTEKE